MIQIFKNLTILILIIIFNTSIAESADLKQCLHIIIKAEDNFFKTHKEYSNSQAELNVSKVSECSGYDISIATKPGYFAAKTSDGKATYATNSKSRKVEKVLKSRI